MFFNIDFIDRRVAPSAGLCGVVPVETWLLFVFNSSMELLINSI